MNALPLLFALALVSAGCIGAKDDPATTAAIEPEDAAVSPAATDDVPPGSAPGSTPAPSSPPSAQPAAPPAEPNATGATEPPAPPAPPRIDLFSWDGSITAAGLGAQAGPVELCCESVEAAGENTAGTFEVPSGVRAVVVELVWSDTTFDLDLDLEASDVEESMPPAVDATGVRTRTGHAWAVNSGNTASPDGHATIVVTDEEALALGGTWSWRVHSKGANDIAFQVFASLFYDATPPADYTGASHSGNP